MPSAEFAARFAILHHVMPARGERATHWDLLLATADDEQLITWALDKEPTAPSRLAAQQLPPHRRLYLDYEGPVSGGRGTVMRWDAGTYEMLERTATKWRLKLFGARLPGVLVCLELQDAEQQRWLVTLQMPSAYGPD